MPIDVLRKMYFEWMEKQDYTKRTIKEKKRIFNDLEKYMRTEDLNIYRSIVGIQYHDSKKVSASSYRPFRNINRMLYILDCLINTKEIHLKAPSKELALPNTFQTAYDSYITNCIENGNRDRTLVRKKMAAKRFFCNITECGCGSVKDLSPEIVLRAALIGNHIYQWTVYRQILRFLEQSGQTRYDYSALIPSSPNSYRIPDIYSKEEILRLEDSFDRTTPKGMRDYSMILLASRLELRSSDIAGLRLDSIDFENDRLSVTQKKTDVPLIFPLLPEIKNALQQYIQIGRPKTACPSVFIRTNAPYTAITTGVIYHLVSDAFKSAGVDTAGKRHGPHALRASGTTHMINNGIPYPIVQKVLGHQNENIIQSYAKLDVENLRKCALQPPDVSSGSLFESFLNGGVDI